MNKLKYQETQSMLNGHKFQHLEMAPNKPQYLNQNTIDCVGNYSLKLPSHNQNIDYDKSIFRPRLIQKVTQQEQYVEKVKSDNDKLQLYISQLENKAQLAENKLVFKLMNEEKTKYEKLSSRMNSKRNSRIDSCLNSQLEPINNFDIAQNARSNSLQQQNKKDQKTNIQKEHDMPLFKGNVYHYDELNNHSVLSQQHGSTSKGVQEIITNHSNQPMKLAYHKNNSQQVQINEQVHTQQSTEFDYPSNFKSNYNSSQQVQINQQVHTEQPTEFYYPSNFKSNYNSQYISNQTEEQQSNKSKKSIIKNKFRNICHAIIAGLRLSKLTILKSNLLKKRLKILNTKVQEISSQLNQNLNVERNWVKQMIWKMVGTMTQSSFYEQYTNSYNPQSEISKDMRQRWTIIFTKQCFQCIELLTRSGNIPENLINKMKLQVFKSENQTLSQFVALRTKLISEDSMKLSAQSKKLILNEYLIYNVIISNMFQLSNRIQYQNVVHQQECKILFMSVATLLQIHFIQIFQDMPENPENLAQQTTVQRIVQCQDKMILNVQLKGNQNQESQTILKGLYPQNFRVICKMNKKVQEELEILFIQFVNNININIQI